MDITEWQQAMIAANAIVSDRIRENARLWQAMARDRREGHAIEDCPSWPALQNGIARSTAAYAEADRVKALRPPYAPDWVDAMGRKPEAMMPEVQDADDAKGET